MNDRPVGVTILAVLHLLGGVLLCGSQALLLGNLERLSETLTAIGVPLWLLVAGLLLLAGLGLAAGVGMLMGKAWGWWCATFYAVYSIARYGKALLMISEVAEAFEASDQDAGYHYLKFSLRILVQLLILAYLFGDRVMNYFDLENLHKSKALGQLAGATVAAVGIVSTIAWLSS